MNQAAEIICPPKPHFNFFVISSIIFSEQWTTFYCGQGHNYFLMWVCPPSKKSILPAAAAKVTRDPGNQPDDHNLGKGSLYCKFRGDNDGDVWRILKSTVVAASQRCHFAMQRKRSSLTFFKVVFFVVCNTRRTYLGRYPAGHRKTIRQNCNFCPNSIFSQKTKPVSFAFKIII